MAKKKGFGLRTVKCWVRYRKGYWIKEYRTKAQATANQRDDECVFQMVGHYLPVKKYVGMAQ